jgi:hypothetical protein
VTGTTLHADTLQANIEAKELRRWVTVLGSLTIVACAFTAAALSGLGAWLLAPAIVVGPGFGGIALIWLALSSDTNGSPRVAAGELHASALLPAEPTSE